MKMGDTSKENPWDKIGNQFIEQYYQMFDIKENRPKIGCLYHPTDSLLSFEGAQFRGRDCIVTKLSAIPLDNILRKPTVIDCQPTTDGGVLIYILGQLRNSAENDQVMGFSQTFLLRQVDNSFFIFNDIFRLVLHNFQA